MKTEKQYRVKVEMNGFMALETTLTALSKRGAMGKAVIAFEELNAIEPETEMDSRVQYYSPEVKEVK